MSNEITKQIRQLMIKDCEWFKKKFEILDSKMVVIKKELDEMIEVLKLEK